VAVSVTTLPIVGELGDAVSATLLDVRAETVKGQQMAANRTTPERLPGERGMKLGQFYTIAAQLARYRRIRYCEYYVSNKRGEFSL
jgi:hypothetical protein